MSRTVCGEGPADARLFLIGEQPGDQEDREGRPFVGPAGRILDKALVFDAELAEVDPAVVVVLGASAGQALFGSRFRVGTARGQVLDLEGRPVIATIHPSAGLRVREPADRDGQYAGLVADLRRALELTEEDR